MLFLLLCFFVRVRGTAAALSVFARLDIWLIC